MRDLFRLGAIVLVSMWFLLLVAIIAIWVLSQHSPRSLGPSAHWVMAHWGECVFGILPLAAILQIAVDVADIRKNMLDEHDEFDGQDESDGESDVEP